MTSMGRAGTKPVPLSALTAAMAPMTPSVPSYMPDSGMASQWEPVTTGAAQARTVILVITSGAAAFEFTVGGGDPQWWESQVGSHMSFTIMSRSLLGWVGGHCWVEQYSEGCRAVRTFGWKQPLPPAEDVAHAVAADAQPCVCHQTTHIPALKGPRRAGESL